MTHDSIWAVWVAGYEGMVTEVSAPTAGKAKNRHRMDLDMGIPYIEFRARRVSGPRSAVSADPFLQAEEWNRMNPPGTLVTYYSCRRSDGTLEQPHLTKTRGNAFVVGGHTAVVHTDYIGAACLTHLAVHA